MLTLARLLYAKKVKDKFIKPYIVVVIPDYLFFDSK